MKKHTIEDAQQLAKIKNGLCLSVDYINNRSKMQWKCEKGHTWFANVAHIKEGGWCPDCERIRRSNDIQDCYNLAKLMEGEFVSKEYTNSRALYLWKCKSGHIFAKRMTGVQKGRWCRICKENAPKTIEDCYHLANKNGGKFLSKKYINSYTKYKWSCKNNHIFESTFGNIRANHWCPYCNSSKRITIGDCHSIAARKNGKFLSSEIKNRNTKHKWSCQVGHEFLSTYGNIKAGKWCIKCSGLQKKTLDDCHNLAKKMNGEFLSTEYKNANTKYRWKCEFGHEFVKSYHDVQGKSWCPKCRFKLWKTQRIIASMVSKLFPHYTVITNFKGFEWLKTKMYGKQELDIWIPELKLAIEYDGELHFMAIDYFGGQDAYEQVQQLDAIKNQKIAEHPEDVKYFIRFSYKEAKQFNEEYRDKI